MPNIPIPLVGGQNIDQPYNDLVVSREALNMCPEVQQYGSTILRNTPGFAADQAYTTTGSGNLLGVISVNEDVYAVRANGIDGELYLIDVLVGTITLKGTMTGMGSSIRMASNGENIVIVNATSTTALDYVYDISAGTLVTIESVDAGYATLGRALDVTYYQGYYFFINTQIVFHGDLKTDAGTGVNFNILSFAPLPFTNNEGRGIEEIGGQIYVMGTYSMFLYSLVGTTPFVLQQQVGSSVDVGIVTPNSKVKVRDALYLYGQKDNESPDFYRLSGFNTEKISNNAQVDLDEFLTAGSSNIKMSAHVVRGDDIIWFRQSQGSGDTYAFNATLSAKTGTKSWYLVGGFEDSENRERSSFMAGTLPITADLTITAGALYAGRYPRLFFVHADSGVTDLYVSLYDENYTEISQDVISNASKELVSKFVFGFDYIRQDGEPVIIKSLRFKLIDSGMTAELQYTDGTNSKTGTQGDNFPYISLGEITPTSNGVVEWRRIGRVASQRSFRLILSNPNNGGLFKSVSGGIISGAIKI